MKKILLCLALLSLLLVPQQASACTRPSGDAWLIIHGDGSAWLIFHKATLVSAVEMKVCELSINLFPGVVAVTEAGITNSATGEPIANLQFHRSRYVTKMLGEIGPRIGTGVPDLVPVSRWVGFLGNVEGPLQDGLKVDIMFDLRLDPSMTSDEILKSLNAQGAYSAGALDDNGLPTEGHFAIQRPTEIGVMFE